MTRVVAVVTLLILVMSGATTSTSAQEPCRFVLGFATLRDLVGPQKVGNCLEDERFNLENGNAEQRTTGGLLVWRKVDNFTAFTDGGTTWVNGPFGLQSRPNSERFSWEKDPVQPSSSSAPAAPSSGNTQPAPTATPTPRTTTNPPASAPTATPRPPTATPVPDPPRNAGACCRTCTTGKACGDSCISRSLTCRVGAGCACNGLVEPDSPPVVMTAEELIDEARLLGELNAEPVIPCETELAARGGD